MEITAHEYRILVRLNQDQCDKNPNTEKSALLQPFSSRCFQKLRGGYVPLVIRERTWIWSIGTLRVTGKNSYFLKCFDKLQCWLKSDNNRTSYVDLEHFNVYLERNSLNIYRRKTRFKETGQMATFRNLFFNILSWPIRQAVSICVISGFCREVAENCALLGYYAASSGNSLPTFRDNLSVPFMDCWPLEMGPIGCPKTSARSYHYPLCDGPEEHLFFHINSHP